MGAFGSYGTFSALYGLGADQIVGAKAVNSKGDLVEVSDELLDFIIGGGGINGVIVELTIKVYSLKEVCLRSKSEDISLTLFGARSSLPLH